MANPHPKSRKGVPNKPKPGAELIKASIAGAWETYINSGKMAKDIAALDADERLRTMSQLARFVAPTLKAVDATLSTDINIDPLIESLSKLIEEQ